MYRDMSKNPSLSNFKRFTLVTQIIRCCQKRFYYFEKCYLLIESELVVTEKLGAKNSEYSA